MKKYYITTVICFTTFFASGQVKNETELDYFKFIEIVKQNNIAYAAERFNINIAETETISAKAFIDPEIQLGYFDNGESKRQMGIGYSGGIAWTIELGGKRKARINLAKSEYELSKLILSDYFNNLKADASLAFLTVIFQQEIVNLKTNSFQTMKKLAEADEIRMKLGEISEIDVKQSLLEAQTLKNEVTQAEADLKTAKIRLFLFMGEDKESTNLELIGELNPFPESLEVIDLMQIALNNRSDLMAALQNKNVSQHIIQLAKANRAIDLGINLGVEHSTIIRNPNAETPQFTQLNGGISIPLKLSNKVNYELKQAEIQLKQSELNYEQILLQIKTEVKETFANYDNYKQQLQQYNLEMLKNADSIFQAKLYSYKRGNSSLLELLNAQRTFNEIQSQYIETLFNCASSYIELERVTGGGL